MNFKLPLAWQKLLSRFYPYTTAFIIFLFGLILSFAAYRFYQNQDLNRARAEFNHVADLRLYLIRDLLIDTLEQIEFVEHFYYASDDVTKRDFHIFVRSTFRFYPNLLAIGWHENENANETKPQTKKSLKLDFVESTSAKTVHSVPFTYLEIPKINKPFFIESDFYPAFTKYLQKSSENRASVTVLNHLELFQGGKKKVGFALFKPIFFEEVEGSTIYKGLFGTIVAFSNFEDVITNVKSIIEPLGINISIYDISKGSPEFLYKSVASIMKDPPNISSAEQHQQDEWSRHHIFNFGDRTWELKATPTLGYIQARNRQYWSHWEVPLIGILISTLMASYFFNLINRKIEIEKEVREQTQELGNTNKILQKEIHERKRIEDDFSTQQRYLQRRHEALEYLTKLTTSELRSAIHEVILRAATVMQIDRVSVWLYEKKDDIQTLSCTGLYILSTNSFSNHLEFTSTFFPQYFNALSKQTPLILPSAQNAELNQELSSYLAVFHITSKLDIPIVFEGKLLGVLFCEETRGQRAWLMDDRHFGQTIADIVALMIEQSARRKAEKALQESEERIRFITQKAVDGIISVNENEEIISWNLGAERIFGYNEKEIMGQSLQILMPQSDFFKEELTTKSLELKAQHKTGFFFPIEISHTRWKSGEHYFGTIICRDITERKETEKKLIQDMHEAKDANAAKNEFLATISHELRTPLNAIIGFVQCLLIGMDGPINEAQRQSLIKIEKSSFQLLSLINDILDLAKIEANRMELEIIPSNIVALVTSCVDEMKPIANKKNLPISLSIQKSFILVEFDKVRLKQVLLNLLSNAIKFTEKGSISVSVHNLLNEVSIQVTDTGIGLNEEEKSKLFKPFSQADSSITRKYGGTGLGLVISKKIIEFHSGTISVESEKGKGSTFTITLPKIQ